jgi:hypothetical protein
MAIQATLAAANATRFAIVRFGLIFVVMVVSCLSRKGGMPFDGQKHKGAPAGTDVLASTKARIFRRVDPRRAARAAEMISEVDIRQVG